MKKGFGLISILIIIGIIALIGGSYYYFQNINQEEGCIQIITYAQNPETKKCEVFSSPCVIPKNWEKCEIDTGVTNKYNTNVIGNLSETSDWKKICYLSVCIKYPDIDGYQGYQIVPPEKLDSNQFIISQEHPGNRFRISRLENRPQDFDILNEEVINDITFKRYFRKREPLEPAVFDCGYLIKHNKYYYRFNSLWCNKKSNTFELMMKTIQFE